MQAVSEVEISTDELRVRIWEFGRTVTQTIEATADEIERITTDPVVRRNALIWKIYGISGAQAAVMQPDPLVATLDVWAFCLQMAEYLEEGDGKELFGSWQDIAVRASHRLVEDCRNLAITVSTSGEISGAEDNLKQWVARNKIEGPLLKRTSVMEEEAEALGWGSMSPSQTLGALDMKVGYIMYRLAILDEYWPRQLRWHLDLMLDDMVSGDKPSRLPSVRASLERVLALAEQSPDFITGERIAVLQAMNAEINSLMQAIDAQRVALTDDARLEREIIFQDLQAERAEVMAEMEALVLAAVTQSLSQSNEVIDHFFWRAVQLMIAFLAGLAILAAVTVAWLRRKPGAAGGS
jgi:hypothetical protein